MSSFPARVLIVNYGMGNIRSLGAAIQHLGRDVAVSADPSEVRSAEQILLPGVGSFPVAMAAIEVRGLKEALIDAASSGKSKLLGICLGMQLLMDYSEEGVGAKGLGLVGGSLERFPAEFGLPVPHIGFNTVDVPRDSVLFHGLDQQTDFYFVHSYRAKLAPPGTLAATSHYGESFVAAFEGVNVYGTQFHPEKSQSNGLQLLENFLSIEIR